MASLDEEESADAKTRREDVLNQLMTLLNTAYTAGKRTEAEEAAEAGQRPKARISTQQPQQAWSSQKSISSLDCFFEFEPHAICRFNSASRKMMIEVEPLRLSSVAVRRSITFTARSEWFRCTIEQAEISRSPTRQQ